VSVDEGRSPSDGASEVERLVARVLLVGGVLGVAVALVGLVLYATQGGLRGGTIDLERELQRRAHGQSPAVFLSVREVVRGVTRRPFDPLAVMELGLLMLVGTPALGVTLAVPAFLAVGDRQYAVIAGIVLAILVVGFLITGSGA
jgi:uncharacterized membrane protein